MPSVSLSLTHGEWSGCRVDDVGGAVRVRLPRLRTLSGNELAPKSLKGSLNFRFSSLPLMMILIVMGMSGDDAVALVAIVRGVPRSSLDDVSRPQAVKIKVELEI